MAIGKCPQCGGEMEVVEFRRGGRLAKCKACKFSGFIKRKDGDHSSSSAAPAAAAAVSELAAPAKKARTPKGTKKPPAQPAAAPAGEHREQPRSEPKRGFKLPSPFPFGN